MVGGDLELRGRRIVPHNRAINTKCEELRQFLDRRIGGCAKRVLAALDWLPLLNFVCFESERTRVGYVCFAQVLHRNRNGCLAVARSKCESCSVNVKIPRLTPQNPHEI